MQHQDAELQDVEPAVQADVVVIGAGIVGLAAAARLQVEGRQVLVIDRTGISEETSSGNAGAFAFPNILPLASPGIMKSAPRWLLDPLGPLALKPSYLPRLVPWMVRFWRASRRAQVQASTEAQAKLMALCSAETEPMLEQAGARNLIRREGSIEVYESEAEFQAARPGWHTRAQHGIPFEHLTGPEAIASLQPGLDRRFVRGVFVPGWKIVSDPKEVGVALGRSLVSHGGKVRRGVVTRLQPGEGGVRLACAAGQVVEAAQVVLAAGAWSHRLAQGLGDRIPLETERGYNTTLPADAFDLRLLVVFGGHGFVVSPLASGIRVGGAVEFAGLEAAPNYKRAEAMLEKAKRFMPGLRTEGGRQWMGYRPSLPDTLPVIGRAPRTERIVYAFGHGHLGLTQSAGTARLVADLIQGRSPTIDLAPFRPDRFGGSW